MDFTPHTDAEVAQMLRVIGVDSIDALFRGVPEEFKVQGDLRVPGPMTEAEVTAGMKALAARNASPCSFLGAGAYDHHVPAAVHHLVGRGEFLTGYTPYQPEVSQGTLQAQFEYQTMVASLLGMDVANASMYEGATALAEAVLMCGRQVRRPAVLVSKGVHPEYREVLATYAGRDRLIEVPLDANGATDIAALRAALSPDVGVVAIQSPNFLGVVEDLGEAASLAHGAGAMLVATFTEPLAFGLVEPPGALGADAAAGEGQSLGLPLSFGGPYIGFFAVKSPLVKAMPGRLVGRTRDTKGNPCYVLTLAAREQHIRRERASSNICTNEGLCALAVAIWMSLVGKDGLRRLALYNHHRAERVKAMLADRGVPVAFHGPTFNEFAVRLREPADRVVGRCAAEGLVPGLALSRFDAAWRDLLLVCVTEQRSDADLDHLADALSR